MGTHQMMLALDTRNESYKALIADGKELPQILKLYDLYKIYGDLSDRRAAELLHLPEARISARRNKLVENGYSVIDKGIIIDKITNRKVHLWGINL